MRKILFFVVVISTATMMLSSCQKEASTQTASKSTDFATALNQFSATHYEAGSIYQVELSANISGTQGGGLWLWIGLHPDGTGDYSGADCGHGGAGAASDKGDATWHYTGLNDASIEIDGVVLVGLGGFVSTITVPSTYGHYTGTIGSFITLPGFIPPGIGFSQLQVAP